MISIVRKVSDGTEEQRDVASIEALMELAQRPYT
jgi:hypothetical protein